MKLLPEAQALVEKYSTGPTRAVFIKTDVTDWRQLKEAFDACKREFGGIDIVGPGAGVFEENWSSFWYPPGSGMTVDTLDTSSYKTLDINITHPIRSAQMAISEFLNPDDPKDKASATNPKRIIMTSSIAGQIYGIFVPLYFASKHAIMGFTRSMGILEESHSIRVNGVAPGIVKTPIWTEDKLVGFNDEADEWVTPEEVAEHMVGLLESPAMVGGTILEVGAGEARVVPPFMNPGPPGKGTSITDAAKLVANTFDVLAKPGWGKV